MKLIKLKLSKFSKKFLNILESDFEYLRNFTLSKIEIVI